MATEALTSLLLEKLASAAIDRVGRVLGVRSELEKLRSELSAIQAVIHDAEVRSVTERNVQDWVAKLKDAAYDVDDMLDEFQTYADWRKQDASMSNKVRIFFSRSNPLAFRFKMSSKIKSIVEKLDMIAQERIRYKFTQASSSNSRQHQMDTRMTAAVITETNVYGRDDDVEEILKLLLEKETDKLSVVTIVGLGGLGKTTLAQLLYNHERVAKKESFDSRIWVCVSDPFDIKRIAKAIIEFDTKGGCDLSELATVVNCVQEILENKKFLLVLDDVWNENERRWEELKAILAVGAKGSKIMVTTRSEKVASIMGGTISPYRLGVLSEDDCWRLFEKRAFRADDVQRYPYLKDIGRQIVAKCGGSPLAAKALGSLMSFKRERGQWEAVRDSNIWRDEGNHVMASLRLSYDHLSPELKQCFTYCCIFPKDTNIKRDELVLHWIAMGFIPSNTSNEGREYFDSLLWISFLDEHSSWLGAYFKMHDLVHDLAKSVAGDEHFICYADQKATIPQRCRFCSLVGTLEESELKDLFSESSKIRALHLQDSNIISSILYTSLPRLRVLDMKYSTIKEVHASIYRLKQLRYFRIDGNQHILQLPNSIGGLRNLLALDASFCFQLRSVPDSIGKLANLRTLSLSICVALRSLPQSLCNLSKLDALVLRMCPVITELPYSIGKLANLRTLNLSSCVTLHSLPQSLGNLSKLEELDLQSCYVIAELPESIGKLANLRTLKLMKCQALKTLPQSLGNLSNLEELDLQRCTGIAELPKGMESMTSLRHLRNEGMLSLRGMPSGIGKMRGLETLQLFVVGEGINHSSIVELQHLNLIAGKLELTHLENVKRPGDAASANMKEKHRLEMLCLRWSDLISDDPCSIHEEVLADLIPHPNLEKLEIESYPGINFPNWVRMMGVSVPNLVELILSGLKCLPSFVGGLLQLKALFLSDMPDVEKWRTVVAGVELYPRLFKLKTKNCPKMHAEPCIPISVKELLLDGDINELLFDGDVNNLVFNSDVKELKELLIYAGE